MKVYFVGAGPGDPELLTIKAKNILELADVVIYAGSLINPEILKFTKGYLVDSSPLTLEEIMNVMINSVRDGKLVVRLTSGDPSLYSAIGEQIEILEREGIDYEIVPGVSSFLAAASVLKKELTVPEIAQTVIITRGEGRTKMPPTEKLSELAKHQTTMVIFLSTHLADKIQEELLKHYPEDTPIAIVHKATWKDEKVLRGVLKDLAKIVKENRVFYTSILIVGKSLTHRNKSKLYDKNFYHRFRPPQRKE